MAGTSLIETGYSSLVKKAMGTRLKEWGSFFERYQERSCTDSDNAEEETDVSFDFNDPVYKAVDKKHENDRRSLISKYGLKESSDPVYEAVDEKHKNDRRSLISEYDLKESSDPVYEAVDEKHENDRRSLISEYGLKESSEDSTSGESYGSSIFSKVKRVQKFKTQRTTSKGSLHLSKTSSAKRHLTSKKAFHKQVVTLKSNDQKQLVTSTPKDANDTRRLKEKQPSVEIKQDYWEQYDLWKLYKRRNAGKFGSVFIVSNLQEDPSHENRFVPNFPSKIQRPKMTPRRFSLQS